MLPIVYKWTDGNAPVARGERRSMCDILRACLVDGYGEKPPAGWTLEYINATEDQAAFRNNPAAGTGFFLRVDGAGSTYAYASHTYGYESMTSEVNGLNIFYNSVLWFTSNSAGTTARPWILIADDRAFYFYCWTASTGTDLPPTGNNSCGFFFGDLAGCAADDAYGCGHTAYKATYLNASTIGTLTIPSTAARTGDYSIAVARKKSGAVGSYLACTYQGGGPGATDIAGKFGLARSAGDPIFITRPCLNEGVAYSFRGYWPGLYYPCHPFPFGQFQEIIVDGRSFISLRVSVSYNEYGNLLISLDDWRV